MLLLASWPHDQAFEIGRLGQATCSVWSSAMLIKVQGNPGQAGFLFHRVATKQACMKSSHTPRLGKRCSGRKPNWPYISLVHTYTCLARAIHIDPSNTLRPCSLSLCDTHPPNKYHNPSLHHRRKHSPLSMIISH